MTSPTSVSRSSSNSTLQSYVTAPGDRAPAAPRQEGTSTTAPLQAPPGLHAREGSADAEGSGASRPRTTLRQLSIEHRKSLTRMSTMERQRLQAQTADRLQAQTEARMRERAEAAGRAGAGTSSSQPLQDDTEDVFYDAVSNAGNDSEGDTASMLGSRRVDSSRGNPARRDLPPFSGSLGDHSGPLPHATGDNRHRSSRFSDRSGDLSDVLARRRGIDAGGYSRDLSGDIPRTRRTRLPDELSTTSTILSTTTIVSNVTHAIHVDPPSDSEAQAVAPPPGPPTWGDTAAALGATFGQRATTYFGAHAGAWVLQAASVALLAGARGGQASRESMTNLSNLVGGASSAVLKEAIGETMKTMPRLGATISLPGETVLQREGPRVMAGFNDMWTAIGGAMLNVAVGARIGPMIEQSLRDRGLSPELARPMSMMASALVQRMVSASADTVSDLTSTLAKSFLPGARAGHVVNASLDRQTMLGGITARGLLNFGLTLPLGPLITLRKLMATNDNNYQRAAASNAMAWASLNGWIVAKAHISAFYKTLEAAAPATAAPAAAEAATQQPAGAGEVEMTSTTPYVRAADERSQA
ncbi:hypothetical protein RBH89_20520 [Paracidovorax avenae]